MTIILSELNMPLSAECELTLWSTNPVSIPLPKKGSVPAGTWLVEVVAGRRVWADCSEQCRIGSRL